MKKLCQMLLLFLVSPFVFAKGAEITISTCQELQDIRQNPAQDYIITQDIDCEGFAWEPIEEVFTGSLDGQDHIIQNLIINTTVRNSRGTNDKIAGGIFLQVYKANIKNIHFGMLALTVEPPSSTAPLPDLERHPQMVLPKTFKSAAPNPYASGFLTAFVSDSKIENVTFSFAKVDLSHIDKPIAFGFFAGVNFGETFSGTMFEQSSIILGKRNQIVIPISTSAFLAGVNMPNLAEKKMDYVMLVPQAVKM
jgi:hypothetical protein